MSAASLVDPRNRRRVDSAAMASTNGARRDSRSGSSAPASAASGSGSSCARRLRRLRRSSSAATRVGGVWRANTYPGAACDVPSHLYSFSFAPGPPLVAPLRAAGGDPRLPRARSPSEFGITPHLRLGTEVDRGRVRRRGRALDAATDDGEERALRRAGHRVRPAHPARRSRRSRGSRSSRARLPLRRVGPRRRSRPAARGRDRHRRERDPVRPRDRRRSPRGRRSTSARRPGSCRKTDRGYPEWERRAVPALPARVAASRLGHASPSSSSARTASPGTDWALRRRSAGSPNRERRSELPADPELIAPRRRPTTRSAASGCCSPATGIRPCCRDDVELVTGAGRADHARRRRRRRRRRAPGRHDHLRHRLPDPQLRRPDGRARPRRARAERGLGRAARGLPRDHRLRLPEHVRALRAEHQPRLGLGPLHARVAVQLRDRRASGACATAASAGSTCGRRRRRRGGAEMARAQRRHGLDHRRLPQLVPERRAARTPTTGRAPGSSSAGARGGSTPATTASPSSASSRSSTARAAPAVSSPSQPWASGSRSIPARIASSSGPRSCALTVS